MTDYHLATYRCLSNVTLNDNEIVKTVNELNSNKAQGHDKNYSDIIDFVKVL